MRPTRDEYTRRVAAYDPARVECVVAGVRVGWAPAVEALRELGLRPEDATGRKGRRRIVNALRKINTRTRARLVHAIYGASGVHVESRRLDLDARRARARRAGVPKGPAQRPSGRKPSASRRTWERRLRDDRKRWARVLAARRHDWVTDSVLRTWNALG